jgi:transposase
MATRTPYAREFKVETVKLVTERGLPRAQVAREMGIDAQTLRRWMKEFATDGEQAFPGHGHPRDEELVRLRRENEQLRQEREILKKALGSFSRMPH